MQPSKFFLKAFNELLCILFCTVYLKKNVKKERENKKKENFSVFYFMKNVEFFSL